MLVTVLLALTAYRLWRLAALDYLTERLRFRLAPEGTVRHTFVSCPWCLGSWLVLACWLVTWIAVDSLELPGLVLGAASALTGVLGTADKVLDERGRG